MADNRDKLVCLGRIKGPYGLRGELRVQSFTEVPENIAAYGRLTDPASGRQFEITKLRVTKKDVIVRLKGIEDRTAAEALAGVELYVRRSQLGEPEEEESWFYTDLIGLVAVDAAGKPLGHIKTVQNFGAGDLLELWLEATGKTVFIPFTREAVPQVDLPAGKLTIIPPPDLAEELARHDEHDEHNEKAANPAASKQRFSDQHRGERKSTQR